MTGQNPSSSSLWTLVMRISCFLLLQNQQPFKDIPECRCLFLICDFAFVFWLEEFPVARKRRDGMKAEIKEPAEEAAAAALAEG